MAKVRVISKLCLKCNGTTLWISNIPETLTCTGCGTMVNGGGIKNG